MTRKSGLKKIAEDHAHVCKTKDALCGHEEYHFYYFPREEMGVHPFPFKSTNFPIYALTLGNMVDPFRAYRGDLDYFSKHVTNSPPDEYFNWLNKTFVNRAKDHEEKAVRSLIDSLCPATKLVHLSDHELAQLFVLLLNHDQFLDLISKINSKK